MTTGFSVVQVEVKNQEKTTVLYVKCVDGLIDFCEDPWEADRPVLCHDLFERVYDELNQETAIQVHHRMCAFTGLVRNHTVQVSRVDVTLDGWDVQTHISKRSPVLAIQSLNGKENKIVVLNF